MNFFIHKIFQWTPTHSDISTNAENSDATISPTSQSKKKYNRAYLRHSFSTTNNDIKNTLKKITSLKLSGL